MDKNFKILLGILVILVFFALFWNLSTGFVSLNFSDFWNSQSPNSDVAELRLQRVIAVFLAGISIPTSGFLLQEYFQNPLAGPEVLGITSVASLMVACYIFMSQDLVLPEFLQNSFLNISAILGSLLMLLVLLTFSRRISNSSFLIIFGFLISALSGAIISLMQFYANNQSLKNYVLWSFGANNQLSNNQLTVLGISVLIGLFICFKTIKPLMGNALGKQYAMSIGVNLNRLKYLIIIASSLLSASVTAFLGPVLFIGIVIPHFGRMLYNPAKLWQQWMINILMGILVMEVFSSISEILSIPINIITSIFGIPVIIFMLLKGKTFS